MAETISMPKLGFDMAEGLLVRWVKQVGETINKGDVLAEIETDKATVEVESSASGVVLQLIVDQGTMVPVNAPIAIVGQAGEKVDAVASNQSKTKVDEKPAAQTPPTVASASQAVASADTSSSVHGQSSSSKPRPSRRKLPATKKWICPTCKALVLVDALSARILKQRSQADNRRQTVDRQPSSLVHRPPSLSPTMTKLFKPPNSARPSAADWSNPRQPSRTSM